MLGRSVSLRGWDFPHISMKERQIRGANFVGQDCDWEHHVEAWRFSQTGQFVFLGGFWEDWRDQAGLLLPREQYSVNERRLSVVGFVFALTEIYELAARLAQGPSGDTKYYVKIGLRGLQNRLLTIEDIGRALLLGSHRCQVDELSIAKSYASDDLVARARDLAIDGAAYFFERFGWNASRSTLKSMQEELGHYGTQRP